MKKVKKLFFILVVLLGFTCNVNAAKNPYPKYEETIFGTKIINCTWYAWEQAKNNMGVELPLWTYVQTWYTKAKKAGYSVGSEPKANSIMVWDYGEGFGGHVAYVTSVDGTTVHYKEGGSPMTEDGINTDSMTLDMMDSFLVGFIYLDEVPKPVEKPKNTTPSKSEEKPKVEAKPKEETTVKPVETPKSSNNYLSELKISGIDFEFNKDMLDYTFEFSYETQSITIEAKTEDTKAALNGTGTFLLNVGENKFTIAVVAEDSTKKEYHITVTRKEEEKIEEQIPIEEPKEEAKEGTKKSNKTTIVIIAITSLLLLTASILGFIIYKKKHVKNKNN